MSASRQTIQTNYLQSRQRDCAQCGPLATTAYFFFAPLSTHFTKVAGMIERDKLADIDYFLPRKLVTEVIYVLQGCLLYSLNGNVH